jgi:8-oxo-dGTP diphosphatase
MNSITRQKKTTATKREPFAYVIAFHGDRFIMVRHKDRKWEMPGGRLESHETHEQAAKREFIEETGRTLDIVTCMDIDGGKVCVGIAGPRIRDKLSEEIAEVRELQELPSELSFPLVEYKTLLAKARNIMETFKRGEAINGSASPRMNRPDDRSR